MPAIRIDPRRLKQILVNLMVNGIKFTPPGGRVSLKTWFSRQSGFVFQVADTGIGIAAGDIAKALSPFGQVDSRPNRNYEGTGLGLPLTKQLVRMQAGQLDLESEVDIGTTVTVRYPMDRWVATGRPASAVSE
jgi:signal transduction histidine kinase